MRNVVNYFAWWDWKMHEKRHANSTSLLTSLLKIVRKNIIHTFQSCAKSYTAGFIIYHLYLRTMQRTNALLSKVTFSIPRNCFSVRIKYSLWLMKKRYHKSTFIPDRCNGISFFINKNVYKVSSKFNTLRANRNTFLIFIHF